MAPEIGHARPISISAVIIGGTAVIIRTPAVVDGAAVIIVIIGTAVLGRSDRKAGADDSGKSGRRGGTAAPIVSAASAEVSGAAGRGRRRQDLARWRGPGQSQRRLDCGQRYRRNRRHHGSATVGRKHTFSREHLNVLQWQPDPADLQYQRLGAS